MVVLLSIPAIYFVILKPNSKQLLRALLSTLTLTVLIGLKQNTIEDSAADQLHCILLLFYLLAPELTPFATAITLVINLELRLSQQHDLSLI